VSSRCSFLMMILPLLLKTIWSSNRPSQRSHFCESHPGSFTASPPSLCGLKWTLTRSLGASPTI